MAIYSYLTSSMDEQKAAAEVAASRKIIQGYAERHGLTVDREYLEVRGGCYVDWEEGNFDARPLADRPIGKELNAVLKAGDAVIVDNPMLPAMLLLSLAPDLGKRGVELHLAPYDLAIDECFWKIGRHVLEFEQRIKRQQKSEGTALGMAAVKARGGPRGNRPAPGWKHVRGGDGKLRRVPDKEQRAVLEWIVKKRLAGWGFHRISTALAANRTMYKKPDRSAPRGYVWEFWSPGRCERGYREMTRLLGKEKIRRLAEA